MTRAQRQMLNELEELLEKFGDLAGEANSTGDRMNDRPGLIATADASYHYGRKDAFDEAIRRLGDWLFRNRI